MLGKLYRGTLLTMYDKNLLWWLFKRRNPLGQMISVRMTADTRKIDNGCLYINLLTEQLYFLHSVKKGMSKRSRYLITNKQDCGIRSPQIVFQMMTDTTGFAHTGCRNDHLRLCIYIDHLRFIARDCHS